MTSFMPGRELSARFYHEAVRPILDRGFPSLPHAAARLGRGSDVLGFDTAQSMDHDWGPRVALFVADSAADEIAPQISAALANDLPFDVAGIPTHFERHPDGTSVIRPRSDHPITHGVEITSVERFFASYLGVRVDAPVPVGDWTMIPQQRLATVRAGPIHHDDSGTLTAVRESLRWYPHDVWLYALASQWQRIGQEEPFVGRAGDVGDELGSRIVAARQVRELMHLMFLIERQYAPYSKWLGSAFSRLDCADEIEPLLHGALDAADWRAREQALGAAHLAAARRFNALGLVDKIEPRLAPFHTRPYTVPHSERFVDALRPVIRDPDVLALPQHIGTIDQWVDSTDVTDDIARVRSIGRYWTPEPDRD